MADRTATVVDCVILSGPHDAGSSAKSHVRAALFIHNAATAVTGGTDTLACDVNAALQAAFRNAKTYTLRSYALFQTAKGTDEYAATLTNSSNTVKLNPELISDWSTDDTIPASDLLIAGARPYGVYVMCEVT